MERGIVIQQPLYSWEKLIILAVYQSPAFFRFKTSATLPTMTSALSRSGEIDVKTAKDDSLGLNNHELMHALINIVEEFHRQGVRHVVFLLPFP